MKRLCMTLACLASVVAWTQASAKDLSAGSPGRHRPHAVKVKPVAAEKSASLDVSSLNEIRFSNPYAPPEGATASRARALMKRSDFPDYPYPAPTEVKGGLSISMGKDGGGHTTGGLSWGF